MNYSIKVKNILLHIISTIFVYWNYVLISPKKIDYYEWRTDNSIEIIPMIIIAICFLVIYKYSSKNKLNNIFFNESF